MSSGPRRLVSSLAPSRLRRKSDRRRDFSGIRGGSLGWMTGLLMDVSPDSDSIAPGPKGRAAAIRALRRGAMDTAMTQAAGFPVRGSWALVVSNDEVLRVRAIEGLVAAGLECDAASSGIEALASLEGIRRNYAVVVVDLDLADVPGREIEMIAAVMAPSAAVITCGVGVPKAPGGRSVSVRKPALASEFGRAVERLRALEPVRGVTA